MALRRSGLVLLSQSLFLGLIVGCQPAPKPVTVAPPPPASEEDIAAVQADLQQQDPSVRTGSVTSVRPEDNLAAVTLSPSNNSAAAKIKVGDTFTFVDSKQDPQANGSVVSEENDSLLVISYVPAPNGRAPKEGDIAVHLSLK
jgi:hypothetical protein